MEDFNIQEHTHDGINTKKLSPKNFEGFPIYTAVPTHNTLEGTIVLTNVSSVYNLYAMIDGTWRNLTGNI